MTKPYLLLENSSESLLSAADGVNCVVFSFFLRLRYIVNVINCVWRVSAFIRHVERHRRVNALCASFLTHFSKSLLKFAILLRAHLLLVSHKLQNNNNTNRAELAKNKNLGQALWNNLTSHQTRFLCVCVDTYKTRTTKKLIITVYTRAS